MFPLICTAGHHALLSRYPFTVLPVHTNVCFLESLSAQTLVWGSLFCHKGTLLVTVIFFYVNVQSVFFHIQLTVVIGINVRFMSVCCVFLGRISKGCSRTNTLKRRLSILIYLRRQEWWMLHTEPHSFHSSWGMEWVLMGLFASVLDRLRCAKVKIYCLVCPKTNNFQVKILFLVLMSTQMLLKSNLVKAK